MLCVLTGICRPLLSAPALCLWTSPMVLVRLLGNHRREREDRLGHVSIERLL